MCLYSAKKFEITTAEKDIPVYKVLYRPDRKTLYPPLYNDGRPYRKGEVLHTVLDEMERCEPKEPISDIADEGIGTPGVYVFDEEYKTRMGFYSETTKKAAREFKDKCCYPHNKCKIYRCIIPKGSRYITGGGTYVSDALKVVRRCIIQ